MDFDALRSQVTKSAQEAASAVQSFHTLDRMAAEDEYIKTEGLNVTRSSKERAKKKPSSSPPRGSSTREKAPNSGGSLSIVSSVGGSREDAGASYAFVSNSDAAASYAIVSGGGDGAVASDGEWSVSTNSAADAVSKTPKYQHAIEAAPQMESVRMIMPQQQETSFHTHNFHTPMLSSRSPSRPQSRPPSRPPSRPSSRRGSGTGSVTSARIHNIAPMEQSKTPQPIIDVQSVETAKTEEAPSEIPVAVAAVAAATAPSPEWSLLDRMLSPADSLIGAGERVARSKAKKSPVSPDDDYQGSRQWLERRKKERESQQQNGSAIKQPYVMSIVAALLEESGDIKKFGAGNQCSESSTVSADRRYGEWEKTMGIDESTRAFEAKMGLEVNHDDECDEENVDKSRSSQEAPDNIGGLLFHFDSDEDSSDGCMDSTRSLNVGGKMKIKGRDPTLDANGKDRPLTNVLSPPSMLQPDSHESVKVDSGEQKKKKDPNRFFDELDRRLAAPVPPSHHDIDRTGSCISDAYINDEESGLTGSESSEVPQPPTPGFRSFVASTNKLGWLRNVAAPHVQSVARNVADKIQERRKGESAPLTRTRVDESVPKSRRMSQSSPLGDYEADYAQNVSSNSVLATSEQAELERLRQNAVLDPVSALMSYASENSRFAFVAFTMVLAGFVYFYTRKRTEDDVT
mmetsp:Transcript_26208/g.77522  ORF Transcript_26208/g.77522 Transcript_26208/m.77522 type:complete len:686 (-) Transcript_26208:383-2440(-)|eukprot:CAMPEP_0113530818 /NCGR_PEP_ID=MMETSP0015_2-20120614/3158_1 /TAXON_ID=2838 /ORGANISM="Odontella" /LENGTH=685 /DNA_ID=CAMNT_0000429597 /DNA_START=176 /DNA_END=2233 /DNA_ORIENTATION=+ /assembly_acc=CAM_ASM_000160